MNIEIVEFYKNPIYKKGSYIGTLHVYLTDFDMDLRGIKLFSKKGYIHINLPTGKTKDTDGTWVMYTFISFTNKERCRELVSVIREAIPKFMKEWFKENPGEKKLKGAFQKKSSQKTPKKIN